MNCRRAKKLIFEFVDGLSDEKVQLDLERHLGECPECDTLASQLTQSLDFIHRAPQEEVDENFNWKVRLAIHKERNAIQERAASQGSLFRAWNFRYAASAVSGFAVILVAGWLAINAGLTPVPVSEPLNGEDLAGMLDDKVIATFNEAESVAETPMTKARPNGPVVNRPASPGLLASTVADGAQKSPSEPRAGAIDRVGSSAELDSLVNLETKGLSESQRVRYFEKRISQLQDHLEKCKKREHR